MTDREGHLLVVSISREKQNIIPETELGIAIERSKRMKHYVRNAIDIPETARRTGLQFL